MDSWNNRLDTIDEKVNSQVTGVTISERKDKRKPKDARRDLSENIKR